MRIFAIGYPTSLGGAGVELWHAIRLWREYGLDVTCVPTWTPNPRWQAKLEAIGCKTAQCPPKRLWETPGIQGSIAVAFCNAQFARYAPEHRDKIGAKLVWARCQTRPDGNEEKLAKQFGPYGAYVCQSRFLLNYVREDFAKWGIDAKLCHLIPGAFHVEDFAATPLPHENGQPFVIGRLSGYHPRKYTGDCWEIFERIKDEVTCCEVQCRVMGWQRCVRPLTGDPPEWVEAMPPETESVRNFLGSLHVLIQFGDAQENWPRVGLEAMAAGVPIITQNRGGWPEMVKHGETGFLCDNSHAAVLYAAELAWNESERLRMAAAAKERVEELADPDMIWAAWKRLFEELSQ